MSSQSPSTEETHSDSQIEGETTPLGIRLTLMFLRLLTMVMIFPLLGACFLAVISLLTGSISDASFVESMVFSVMGLGGFVVMLTMIMGAAWLDSHLNHSPIPFASTWVAARPAHPARQVILPAIMSLAFYGYAAVVLWIPAHLDGGGDFRWPATWGCVAAVATLLWRSLREKLPG